MPVFGITVAKSLWLVTQHHLHDFLAQGHDQVKGEFQPFGFALMFDLRPDGVTADGVQQFMPGIRHAQHHCCMDSTVTC